MTASQPQIEASPEQSSVEAKLLNADELHPSGWSAFAKLIEPVMRHTADYTVENVLANVKSGDMQGWAIVDMDREICIGAIATRLSTFESGLEACTVVAAATAKTKLRYADWRAIIAQIEDFARFNDCDIVRIAGRAGWSKILPEYTTSYVCIEKCIREKQ